MEGTLAVVTCFAGNFVPKYWTLCNGQLMSIAQNQALFSLLGTTYGGDGVTTFGIPDLRGRAPVSQGAMIGGPTYNLGQPAGAPSATLVAVNLPSHAHTGDTHFTLMADSTDGTAAEPDYNYPAGLVGAYFATSNGFMLAPTYPNTSTIGVTGNSQPIDTRSPFLAINFVLCTAGIFPSRN